MLGPSLQLYPDATVSPNRRSPANRFTSDRGLVAKASANVKGWRRDAAGIEGHRRLNGSVRAF